MKILKRRKIVCFFLLIVALIFFGAWLDKMAEICIWKT